MVEAEIKHLKGEIGLKLIENAKLRAALLRCAEQSRGDEGEIPRIVEEALEGKEGVT